MNWRCGFTVLWAFALLVGCDQSEGNGVQKIKFDLGRNIVETARASGVPKFSADNIQGRISYSVREIPPSIPARFNRPGYEIVASPLYSFTLYADHDLDPGDLVDYAAVQLDTIESHEVAKALVEQLIAQFVAGKWKRHIPATCPAIAGRSSLLDENGALTVEGNLCLDPGYRLTPEEWEAVMARSQRYRWRGDGVLVDLRVSHTTTSTTGLIYDISLDFRVEAVSNQRDAQRTADRIKEGEAKGWGTAAKIAAGEKADAVRNALLEANALKRGDRVVER